MAICEGVVVLNGGTCTDFCKNQVAGPHCLSAWPAADGCFNHTTEMNTTLCDTPADEMVCHCVTTAIKTAAELTASDGAALDALAGKEEVQIESPLAKITAKKMKIDLTPGAPPAVATVPGSSAKVAVPMGVLAAFGGDAVAVVAAINPDNLADLVRGGGDEDEDTPKLQLESAIGMNLYSGGGGALKVEGAAEPILITMPQPKANLTPGIGCSYFDEGAGVWTSEGLVEVDLGDGSMTCATTHLSLFGAILSAFAKALSCSNAKVLSQEGMAKIGKGDWWRRPATILVWILIAIHGILCYIAFILDKQNHKTWSDDMFFTDDAGHGPAADGPIAEIKQDIEETLQLIKEQTIQLRADWKTRYSFLGILAYRMAVMANVTVGKKMACAALQVTEKDVQYLQKTTKKRDKKLRRLKAKGKLPADGTASMMSMSSMNSMDSLDDESPDVGLASRVSMSQSMGPQSMSQAEFTKLSNKVHQGIQKTQQDLAKKNSLMIFMLSVNSLHPYGNLMQFSMNCPRLIRVLLFTAKVFGALMVSSLFFASAGAQDAETSDPECTPGSPMEALIMTIVVGILSSLFSSIPLAIMGSLHKRHFVYIKEGDEPKMRKMLRGWFVKDLILYVISISYIAFCIVFLMAFHANVTEFDATKWLMSAGVSLLKEVILVPMFISFIFALSAKALAQSDTIIAGSTKKMDRFVREEPKPLETNPYDVDFASMACADYAADAAEAYETPEYEPDSYADAHGIPQDDRDMLRMLEGSPRDHYDGGLSPNRATTPMPATPQPLGFESFKKAMTTVDEGEDCPPMPALDVEDWMMMEGHLATSIHLGDTDNPEMDAQHEHLEGVRASSPQPAVHSMPQMNPGGITSAYLPDADIASPSRLQLQWGGNHADEHAGTQSMPENLRLPAWATGAANAGYDYDLESPHDAEASPATGHASTRSGPAGVWRRNRGEASPAPSAPLSARSYKSDDVNESLARIRLW
eukprot:TRINITY_DN4446_c0_g1_i8.p1 TRINITY_DN4446_c0_g1~~TRINITY_DN4446_c0_g1_i8.p1  ORF type:complete len:979 (+),score=208.31 TRINITY_DN4446_c0_g1_i8:1102-4038(+)